MKRHKIRLFLVFVLAAALLTACGSKSAKHLYKEGLKSFEGGNYEEAEKTLSEAVTKNPDKAEYYIAYGMSLIKTQKYDEAQIQFQKAMIDKENQIAKENNKNAYRGMGIAYYESKQYDLAVKAFNKALKINVLEDLNLDILYYKADSQGKAGKYKNATDTYTDILKLTKKDAAAYAKRAQMESNSNETDTALKDYDKAISMDKKNYDFYLGKYSVLKSKKDIESANKVLQQALTIKTKSDEDNFNVAKIHYYQEDDTNAEKELKEAVKNGFTEAYYYLGQIAEKDSEFNSAIKYYEKYAATESGKKSSEAYNELGICYMKKGNYKKALSSIEKGVALNDNFWMRKLSYNEIIALEHLSNYKEAFNKVKIYRKTYPKDKEIQREYEFIKTRI